MMIVLQAVELFIQTEIVSINGTDFLLLIICGDVLSTFVNGVNRQR